MTVLHRTRRCAVSLATIAIAVPAFTPAVPPGRDIWNPIVVLTASANLDLQQTRSNAFTAEVTDRQTHTVPIGTAGSLDLQTVAGDITVIAGSGTSASLEVVRRSRGRTDADARQGLADVRAVINRTGEQRAVVTAEYPRRRGNAPYSVTVSYTVTAPAGTRVNAGTVSGDVTVRNVRGDVSASTVSGNVMVNGAGRISAAKSVSGNVSVLSSASPEGLSINVVSGDIVVDDVRASRVDANSISGTVNVTRAVSERVMLKTTSGDIEYEGTIAPSGRYEFRSHSGDVRATVRGAGFALQANSFSGTLRVEPETAMRGAGASASGGRRDRQRTLNGTVGDGSAALVAGTFSGDVTIVAR